MYRTRFKICGLTRPRDAEAAVAAGADAVGVIFAPSPRQLTLEEAAAVLSAVPPPVARVGVFVDAPYEFVARAVADLGLAAVQYCGAETPAVCAVAPAPAIKVFRVGTGFDVREIEPYRGQVAAVLLDTFVPDKHGGTSTTFAWDSITEPPGWAPLFLAGGLTPGNVGAAIRTLSPFAVDVSSGVESAPGIKDHEKVRAFAVAVRAADTEAAR
jgi:phosphoribosylanthranilate isomerase